MRRARHLTGLRPALPAVRVAFVRLRPAGLCLATLIAAGSALAASEADVSRVPGFLVDSPDAAREERVSHVRRALELTPGEKLVYDVKWSGMPAGQAALSVKWKRDFEGSPAYHIESEARANSFVSVFYPVNDKVITIVDAEGGFSRLFRMSKSEKNIKQEEHIRFDYGKGLAIYEKREDGPFGRRTRKRVRVDGEVQDPLSCLYYLRAVDLSPGECVRMPVHTARRQWVLTVEVLKREEVTIPGLGKVKALRLEPAMRFPGIFVRKGRMVVWVDEETRVPVLMHVDIPLGSMTVTLVSAENSPLEMPSAAEAASVAPSNAAHGDEAAVAAEVDPDKAAPPAPDVGPASRTPPETPGKAREAPAPPHREGPEASHREPPVDGAHAGPAGGADE